MFGSSRAVSTTTTTDDNDNTKNNGGQKDDDQEQQTTPEEQQQQQRQPVQGGGGGESSSFRWRLRLASNGLVQDPDDKVNCGIILLVHGLRLAESPSGFSDPDRTAKLVRVSDMSEERRVLAAMLRVAGTLAITYGPAMREALTTPMDEPAHLNEYISIDRFCNMLDKVGYKLHQAVPRNHHPQARRQQSVRHHRLPSPCRRRPQHGHAFQHARRRLSEHDWGVYRPWR